jgi:hypothetical protein
MAGIHWARGQAKAHGGGSPDLLYHGGPVLTQQSGGAAAVTSIFWGTGWSGDGQNKKDWIDTFYKGMSSSSYESTNTEYTQSGGAHVGTSFTVGGGVTDLSAGPRSGNKTGPILAEVCKMISRPVAGRTARTTAIAATAIRPRGSSAAASTEPTSGTARRR